jgi:protein-S-isoprenylcysteine O-methyltransferase Ste14
VPVPLPVATPPVVAPVTTDNSRESVSIPVPVPLSAAALKRASTAIDVNTDGPAISPLDLSAQLSDGLALLMSTLAETNKRNQFIKDLAETVQLVFKSVVKNVQEGELGKRGEEWFVLVFLFVFIVVVGVGAYLHYLVTSLIWLSSFVYILVGVALMICSLWELKANATPFIYPTKDNTLVSRGVYALVRHPMYGGLVLFCIGRSILANSMVKLLLSVVLAFVLDIVSQIEESLLNKQHPKVTLDSSLCIDIVFFVVLI